MKCHTYNAGPRLGWLFCAVFRQNANCVQIYRTCSIFPTSGLAKGVFEPAPLLVHWRVFVDQKKSWSWNALKMAFNQARNTEENHAMWLKIYWKVAAFNEKRGKLFFVVSKRVLVSVPTNSEWSQNSFWFNILRKKKTIWFLNHRWVT